MTEKQQQHRQQQQTKWPPKQTEKNPNKTKIPNSLVVNNVKPKRH